MGVDDLKHEDIEKEFNEVDKKEEEKKSYENIKKSGDEITAKAKEISPESNENGAIDMVKNKYDLRTKEIEDKFNKGDIGERERNEKMKEVADEFTKDIETLVGTTEGSQAKQNKDYGERKSKENKDYTNKLEDFNKKLGDMVRIKEQNKQAEQRKTMVGNNDKLTKNEREKDPIGKLIEELNSKEPSGNK